jgi:hypothetical protein
MLKMDSKVPAKKELRQFSFIVGGVFLLVGAWPLLFRGELPRFWALATGGGLIILGLLLPRALAPVYRGWMALGHALGWLNTRIILGLLFYSMITPMGLIMRLFGKDPLRLRPPDGEVASYRVECMPRERSHLRNLF